MRLTVLSVAYPFAPVSTDAVGGAEQILAALDQALVQAGQRSIVLAGPGSHVQGELVEIGTAAAVLTEERRQIARRRVEAALRELLRTRRIDLVHMHGVDFCEYLPPVGPPVLATLHLPPSWYPARAFQAPRPRTYLNCVSRAQRRACPPGAAVVATIENGVALDVLQPGARKGRFVLALGRICPEKGFHLALAAAKMADVPLLLAGSVFPYPEHQEYYAREIAPLLAGRRRFLGPIDMAHKRRLVAAARCVLIPSRAPETSSLAAMEALACGTPVVAFRAGALPEIIEHGRTGLLVEDEIQMARAIAGVAAIDPRRCREAAESRFDGARMSRQYLHLFRALAAGGSSGAEVRAGREEAACPPG